MIPLGLSGQIIEKGQTKQEDLTFDLSYEWDLCISLVEDEEVNSCVN